MILAKVREWVQNIHVISILPRHYGQPVQDGRPLTTTSTMQVVASSGFSENKGLGHGLGAQSRGLIKPGIGGSY